MMSIEKNEQTPRSVSILALGDTMWFLSAVSVVFWFWTRIRDGKFDDWWIYWSIGCFLFGYTVNRIGTIMERLENAGY